jgi:hypothetical protein
MRFILSIALFSLFFEASASTLSLKTQEIKGYLVDFKTRSGVDKVQVELISLKSGKRFTTESNDGMFMFKHVPIGKNLLKSTSFITRLAKTNPFLRA